MSGVTPSGLVVSTHDLCWLHDTGPGHPERPERLSVLWGELQRFLENDTGGGARELEPLSDEKMDELRKLGYFDGEERELPVRFVVSSELPDYIDTITLSYTFFDTAVSKQ